MRPAATGSSSRRARRSGGRSSSARDRVRCAPVRRRGARAAATRRAVARENALPQGAPPCRCADATSVVLGVDTIVVARRRDLRQAARSGSRRARRCARCRARRTRCSAASRCASTAASPRPHAATRASPSASSTTSWSSGTCASGEWRDRAGGYAIQGRAARWSRDRRRLRQRRRPAGGALLDVDPICSARSTEPRQRISANIAVINCAAGAGHSRADATTVRYTRHARWVPPSAMAPRPHRGAPARRARPFTRLDDGFLQLPDRVRRPRHGRRSRHGQHARLRARARHRAVGAERRRDRLAHRRGARRRDRGQADARPHARARSRRSGRSRTA